jgi:hypothetical protein
MIRGADGDRYQAVWLVVSLPALFANRRVDLPANVGIDSDSARIRMRATDPGIGGSAHADHLGERRS